MPTTDMPTHPIIIQHCDLHLIRLQTRMPFKYGIATMTRVPQLFVRVHVEVDGALTQGIASDLLPPKWFTKDPNKPVDDEIMEMIRVIRHAADCSVGISGQNAFQVWRQLYERQNIWGETEKLPPLLTHFGTSLVERALIEAVCRAAGTPFSEMLLTNRLGVQLGDIHSALRGTTPGDFLPRTPLDQIILRHTVGLSDPLREEDIPSESRLQDGLPQSLSACIQTYGLRHFKIKVTGKLDQDLERLEQIARIIQEGARPDFRFSFDGNEQFHSVAAFRTFWETICGQAHLREFLQHLLFVEQPLHRDEALQPAVAEFFSNWPDRPPTIIDESDATLDSLPTALKLGYAGTSHKNCKGVFKGIANRCLLQQEAREHSPAIRLMSGEDLGTIGPVSVIQDLTAMAVLGIQSVERNGHHYFAGLSMFSSEIQQQVITAHSDLYRSSSLGWPALQIKEGLIQIASLHRHPFGAGFVVDVEQFTPLEKFQP